MKIDWNSSHQLERPWKVRTCACKIYTKMLCTKARNSISNVIDSNSVLGKNIFWVYKNKNRLKYINVKRRNSIKNFLIIKKLHLSYFLIYYKHFFIKTIFLIFQIPFRNLEDNPTWIFFKYFWNLFKNFKNLSIKFLGISIKYIFMCIG